MRLALYARKINISIIRIRKAEKDASGGLSAPKIPLLSKLKRVLQGRFPKKSRRLFLIA
ncbi:hypothetical protein LEP1GSC013_4508 [Leptospira interrogans serovar Valbuzzi str. Duyster]|nr:hypothetical protein LEP1GSC013_4508 [Leptospira interrogans serovar Valbuzzi str. Duyster]ENO73564.1 hypothetical protein LEP1GSC012_1712 [Leptospira interrogans serovar Valbuzzi str. Valbuzzi]